MKVGEFESLDLDLINEAPWPIEAGKSLWRTVPGNLTRAVTTFPKGVATRVAQGIGNLGAGAVAVDTLANKQHINPADEFAGDAGSLAANAAITTFVNKYGFNPYVRGLEKTANALAGKYDNAILTRLPFRKHAFGRGLEPGTTDTPLGQGGGKVAPDKLADLSPNANAWGRVETDIENPNAFKSGGGTTVNVYGAEAEEIKDLRKEITALKAEVAKIGNPKLAATTASNIKVLQQSVDELVLDRTVLRKEITRAVEDGNKGLAKRLKADLLGKFGEEHVKGETFQKKEVNPELTPDEQKAKYGNPNKKTDYSRPAPTNKADIYADQAEYEKTEKAADAKKATPVTAADEKAAAERLAKQGKTKVSAAALAKEIENPTVAYKKEYGGEKGISEPKPDSPEVKLQKAEAAEEQARQIAKAKEATDAAKRKADTLARATEYEQMKTAEAIKKKTGIGIKAGTTTASTASSVAIGATDDVASVTQKLTTKEILEKLGLHHGGGSQAIKQALKVAGKKGAAYLGLSFIPILNVALWGHDVYAVTKSAVKMTDPKEQDKSDAGRHRQVALQQMSQLMMSDASMDEKIDQIEHLFSDSATDTTKQVMLAQIKARNAEERVGITKGDRQHFKTANPEFQAQLDKGPSKLGPQKLVPRVENIWNSSYDNEEQILPVTFEPDGTIATGPNTKVDFKDSLDNLVAKQDEYLTWKRLHANTTSHPIDAKIDAMENAIANVKVAIKSAPKDRKTAFKNYVLNVLAQTETLVANNESAIMKGTLLAEGPSDWLAAIRNWAIDRERLPKSGGAIRGKTSLAKGVKDLDPSDIEDLTKVKPRYDIKGNEWKRISGMSTKDQPLYDPTLDIKGFKPDTVAQAKADYKKPKVDKPVLTTKDLKHSANLRKAFIKTFNTPVTSTNVDDVIAKNTGKKVSNAISKAISSPQFVPSGKEQKMLDRIKDKSKKYSKYTKAEQALMIKTGLTKNTFKQAHAQASANPDNLKTMKLKNGKTLKYFVWNGKKYSV